MNLSTGTVTVSVKVVPIIEQTYWLLLQTTSESTPHRCGLAFSQPHLQRVTQRVTEEAFTTMVNVLQVIKSDAKPESLC